jgi:hypothetical protein
MIARMNRAHVELVRDGTVIQRLMPDDPLCEAQMEDPNPSGGERHWYLLKVTQANGHRAWSSLIWFK